MFNAWVKSSAALTVAGVASLAFFWAPLLGAAGLDWLSEQHFLSSLFAACLVVLALGTGACYAFFWEDPITYQGWQKNAEELLDWTGLHKPRVAVIGSGVCGLTMTAALKHHAFDFDTFERNDDVGGNWYNGVYHNVNIISSRKATEFKNFPMPESWGDFPSAQHMIAYIRAFAEHFGLYKHITLRTEVTRVEKIDTIEHQPERKQEHQFRLTLRDLHCEEKGKEYQKVYDAVVYCNGHHWDRKIPAPWPGQEEFAGEIIHSKDFKRGETLAGKRVLVVGVGNSGCDIAVEASRFAKEAHLSVRRGRWILPRMFCGIPLTDLMKAWYPLWLQRLLARIIIFFSFGGYEKYGLPFPDHPPFATHPTINSELLLKLRLKRITPHRAIRRFIGENTLEFTDGSTAEIDLVVLATGYHVSIPLLEEEGLVTRFKHRDPGGRVYNFPDLINGSVSPTCPNLYVFGIGQPRGGVGVLVIPASHSFVRSLWLQANFKDPVGQILLKLGRKPLTNYYMDPVDLFNTIITYLKQYKMVKKAGVSYGFQ